MKYLYSILLALLLCGCSAEDALYPGDGDHEARPLVEHQVAVSLSEPKDRVGYTPDGGTPQGLALSWNANETLGVYIQKTDGTMLYAGTVSSSGTEGERGVRRFAGTVSAKSDGENYVYLHPSLTETQNQSARGTIGYDSQSGMLGSTAHLSQYIPLVWNEGTPLVANHGYALHLTLTFTEDPGTISSVTVQTMSDVGSTDIFPTRFDAASMTVGSTMQNALTLNTTSTATYSDGKWTAEAYIACSHRDVNVFRTKYNVKVEAANGTYYNEFRSFPGQEQATSITGLPMLANGQCYNLATAMSKGAASTVINSQYKVNSLMGMWNGYGKVTDPFAMVKTTGLPTQLTDVIGTADKRTALDNRMLEKKSSQGSPTFTWTMVTRQCGGSYKQNDVTYNNIDIVNAPTEVYVTFVSEYAWSQNLLGYYHYPTGSVPDHPSTVLKTIIFPNVSKGGHVPFNRDGVDGGANVNPSGAAKNIGDIADAPLQPYTTVQLLYNNPDGTYSKEFPVGTTIGFFIMRDPKASSSGHDEGEEGGSADIDHSDYQPRPDNTLIDWTAWRLFTNTAWNGAMNPYTHAYNNVGWWNMNCQNFFCSSDVGNASSGGVIPGLALYGAKDDASHNYDYSFSAMLYMVSTSNPASMRTYNNCYFNIGTGDQIINK